MDSRLKAAKMGISRVTLRILRISGTSHEEIALTLDLNRELINAVKKMQLSSLDFALVITGQLEGGAIEMQGFKVSGSFSWRT